MFDQLLDPAALRGVDDAAVVAAIEEYDRLEAAAGARRLLAIAELAHRRCDIDGDARAYWMCDFWDGAAAEVAAALGVRHNRAATQMQLGLTLRHRLPKVAALFLDGALSTRVVAAIAWHTHLVAGEALAVIDTALAERAAHWGRLTDGKLAQAIDFWIDSHDPGGLRHSQARARSRDLQVGGDDDASGMAAVWGRLYATDAAVLDRRLADMAHDVCEADPRTLAQRRADALGALAAGSDHLVCGCGSADCPYTGVDARATSVVIHVLADPATLDAAPDPHLSGEDPHQPPRPGTAPHSVSSAGPLERPDAEPRHCGSGTGSQTSERATELHPAAQRTDPQEPALQQQPATPPAAEARPPSSPQPQVRPPAGVLMGGGIVPAAMLAELIRLGATVRHVQPPVAAPEWGYRPSTALAEFVRTRDMTCRFPGCQHPAHYCDIDREHGGVSPPAAV